MTVEITAKRPVCRAKRRRPTARPDLIAAWQRHMAPLSEASECQKRKTPSKPDGTDPDAFNPGAWT
jgi:hypothetical protein